MPHPNEQFLKKFLGTDKEYQVQQKELKKKQEMQEFFIRQKSKKNMLLENEKTSIKKTIDKVFYNSKNKNLNEQSTSTNDWKPVQTKDGIFYFSEKQNAWMNNFGVIKSSLKDFIDIFDYEALAGDSKNKTKIEPPLPPIQLEVSSSAAGITLGWQETSENVTHFNVYFKRELI